MVNNTEAPVIMWLLGSTSCLVLKHVRNSFLSLPVTSLFRLHLILCALVSMDVALAFIIALAFV